jgi:hypothetical protein
MTFLKSSKVPLRDAPQFLNPSIWSELQTNAGSSLTALQMLNAPLPSAQDSFWEGLDVATREQLSHSARSFAIQFRQMLCSRDILAFGFPPASAERIRIPSDREDLWPRFLVNKIVGRDIEFTDVLVCPPFGDRLAYFHALLEYVASAHALGTSLNKSFRFKVKNVFPLATEKEISVAISVVAGRRPGRPRRQK